jgi:hypothetical protein
MSAHAHLGTCRDPRLFDPLRAERAAGQVLVLGLDLGTSTGATFAYHHPDRPVDLARTRLYAGQWNLEAGPYDSGAIRFVRLRQFLGLLRPDAVFFEMVRFTPAETITRYNAGAILARAATSCEFFGALKATVCTWCEENAVPCGSFSIQEIKKRVTGRGNANKADVIKGVNKLFGIDLDPEGYETTGADNVADSVAVCLLGLEQYGAGVKPAAEAGPRA